MKWEIYQAGKKAAREQLPYIYEQIAQLSKEKCENYRVVNLDCYAPSIER